MTPEAIGGGVIAGLIALLLAWLLSPLLKAARTWAANMLASAWRKTVKAAVGPLLSDMKRDVSEMQEAIRRIDSVLAALQLRVHGELRDASQHTEPAADDAPALGSEPPDQASTDSPDEEETDSGAP